MLFKALIQKIAENKARLETLELLELNETSKELYESEKVLWPEFCKALAANETITDLRLGETVLQKLDATDWAQLTQALLIKTGSKNPITRLSLLGPLDKIADHDWKILCKEILEKVSHLKLLGEYLATTDPRWKIFCKTIATSKTVLSLDFACSHGIFGFREKYVFANQYEDYIAQFFDALGTNQSLISLCLDKHPLGLISDVLVKKFFEALTKHPILKDLYLWLSSFSNLTEERWKQFCDFIASKKSLRTLNLRFLYPGLKKEIQDARWKQLFLAIGLNGNLENLALDRNFFCGTSENCLNTLIVALIANKRLNTLDLAVCDLQHCTESEWDFFCDMIAKNKISITTLDISGNRFENLTETQWTKFCKSFLTNNTLKKLIIGHNIRDGESRKHRWLALLETLYHNSTLNSLSLYMSMYGSIEKHHSIPFKSKAECKLWDKFCQFLAKNASITELDYSQNYFCNLDGVELSLFAEAMIKNKTIKTLNLSGNDLHHFASVSIIYASSTSSMSSKHGMVLPIDFEQNIIRQETTRYDQRWKIFCDMIAHNRSIKRLNLDDNKLYEVDDTSWNQLCAAIKNNPVITEISLEKNNLSKERIQSIKNILNSRKTGTQLAAAHVLFSKYPGDLVSKILDFVDGPKALNLQVATAIKKHKKY